MRFLCPALRRAAGPIDQAIARHALDENAARVIKALFRWAEEEDLIVKNPIRRLVPCWGTPKPRGAITRREYAAVMQAARPVAGGRGRSVRSAFRRGMAFMWNTGARTCEMRSATWDQLDWDAGLLRLTSHKTFRRSGRARLIPLGAVLLRLLSFAYRRLGRPATGPIFTNSRGNAWGKSVFQKLFRRFARAAGVRAGLSPYCMRHAFAVEGLEAGVGERQLADVLGHSTTRHIAWYGADVRAKSGYLHAVADQVRGRGPQK